MTDSTGEVVVSALSKQFGPVHAVDNVSFTAGPGPGTVTGFLGPNGAGKTTTMRVLLGLATATSGGATVEGAWVLTIRRDIP